MVAVATVALLASRITTSELQRYVQRDLERNQRLLDTVFRYYNQHRDAADPQALVETLEQTINERVIVTDDYDTVVADSDKQLVGQPLHTAPALRAVIISLDAPAFLVRPAPEHAQVMPVPATVGDVLFVGVPMTDMVALRSTTVEVPVEGRGPPIVIRRTQGAGPDPIAAAFISTVNRALLLAVAAAGLAAVLLTSILSRRILLPVEALTAAARRLERGDLSQRVQVQSKDEIGALGHAFNAMADGLARLEHLRRNMVTDVAHELRTPLTNIRGYLEALRDGVAQPSPALIGSLHEEAMLLNHLIDDLQELALAEAGQLRLVRQPVALDETIAQAVHAVQPAIFEKRLTISVDLPTELPIVQADAERIGQVVRNLLNNAITHTAAGGHIGVAATVNTTEVSVSVHDTGSGIAAEHLPYIFERFYRADQSRSRATGGAGLGLAIVKQLVEAHGGRIQVRSSAGHGSSFSFSLPLSTIQKPV
jgi:signal transduction histidine kinase